MLQATNSDLGLLIVVRTVLMPVDWSQSLYWSSSSSLRQDNLDDSDKKWPWPGKICSNKHLSWNLFLLSYFLKLLFFLKYIAMFQIYNHEQAYNFSLKIVSTKSKVFFFWENSFAGCLVVPFFFFWQIKKPVWRIHLITMRTKINIRVAWALLLFISKSNIGMSSIITSYILLFSPKKRKNKAKTQ